MKPVAARWHAAILLLIVLFGFFLRVHELGRDGLRLDEAGQALAAIQPTLTEMMTIEKTHAAAMPLDYLGTRLAAAIGTQEFLLRYPSAIWGTLSIALIYLLARRLRLSRRAGLLAAFFLALSPNHIYYSQELRFYASLQALALVSTVLLVMALQQSSTRMWARAWVLFGIATAIGAYFHPYVLLTAVFGAIYLVLDTIQHHAIQRRAWLGLIVATTFIGLTFLPGYLIFGSSGATVVDPLQWAGTMQRFLLGGLDWTNKVNTEPAATATAWAWMNLLFIGLGLLAIVRERPRYRLLTSLLIGATVIILLIILSTLISDYWLLSRQIVHLSPILMITAALGVDWLAGSQTQRSPRVHSRTLGRIALWTAVLLLTGIAANQKLGHYYEGERSTGREVALALLATHQGTEPIYVVPRNEGQSYLFYMTAAGRPELGEWLIPTNFDQLSGALAAGEGTQYLALAFDPSADQLAQLWALGLERVVPAGDDSPSHHQLFTRP